MKISKNWLKNYIDIELSDADLERNLNYTGTEVEEITRIDFDNVVIAEVKKTEKIKGSDRLNKVVVSDGHNLYTVVCGADNYNISDKVVLAKVGSKISGIKIEKRKIRGVVSSGMLCSENELGLGDDKSGIIIVGESAKIGEKLSNLYKTDTLFDLDITPNRGDCLSHLGISREIAAFSSSKITKKPISLDTSSKKSSDVVRIEVKNDEDCPYYYARIVEGVSIGPSPLWLKESLNKMGLSSINNVVDVTNYILHDLGQPLHAFDLDKIKKSNIIVRRSLGNEHIITLDGEKRDLSRDELVVADAKEPIAIAGVMGGKNTEVSDTTVNIVIEGAEFNRKLIRRTIKNLKINTEASYRFERGIDPKGIEYAVNKAVKLIKETSGGTILSGFSSFVSDYKGKWMDIEYDRIRDYLDLDINNEEIKSILSLLGFNISNDKCLPPSYRHDIEIWQDLAEEVGRIYGYDNIKPKPINSSDVANKSNYFLIENIKDLLANFGLTEVYNYSFLSESDSDLFNLDKKRLLEIENPLQPENKYLRCDLKYGLLKNIASNSSFDPIEIFEVGNVFSRTKEETHLVIALTSKSKINLSEIIKKMIDKYQFKKDSFKLELLEFNLLKKYKIKKSGVEILEINLSRELEGKKYDKTLYTFNNPVDKVKYRKVSKFPSITRDIAVVVNKLIKSEDIINTIFDSSKLIKQVEQFDEFISDKFGKNKKSVAFHLSIQSDDKTLSVDEGEVIFKKIVSNLNKEFNAVLRA